MEVRTIDDGSVTRIVCCQELAIKCSHLLLVKNILSPPSFKQSAVFHCYFFIAIFGFCAVLCVTIMPPSSRRPEMAAACWSYWQRWSQSEGVWNKQAPSHEAEPHVRQTLVSAHPGERENSAKHLWVVHPWELCLLVFHSDSCISLQLLFFHFFSCWIIHGGKKNKPPIKQKNPNDRDWRCSGFSGRSAADKSHFKAESMRLAELN